MAGSFPHCPSHKWSCLAGGVKQQLMWVDGLSWFCFIFSGLFLPGKAMKIDPTAALCRQSRFQPLAIPSVLSSLTH